MSKTRILLLFTVFVAAFIPYACSHQSDRKFLEETAENGILEITIGEMAIRRASQDEVKEMGQRLVKNYTEFSGELAELARKMGVTLPQELGKENKEKVEKLAGFSGALFNQEFLAEVIQDQKKEMSSFQEKAKHGKNPELKAWASKTLPKLEVNYLLARALKEKPT